MTDYSNRFPGGNSEWEPPDSIPNSEVKTLSADGSVGSPHVRVGHRQDLIWESRSSLSCGFFFGKGRPHACQWCVALRCAQGPAARRPRGARSWQSSALPRRSAATVACPHVRVGHRQDLIRESRSSLSCGFFFGKGDPTPVQCVGPSLRMGFTGLWPGTGHSISIRTHRYCLSKIGRLIPYQGSAGSGESVPILRLPYVSVVAKLQRCAKSIAAVKRLPSVS